MKKLSLYVFLVLMWCNVGVADDVHFNLKLSCTLIEWKKDIEGYETGQWKKTPNKKPVIFRHKKIIKNNKIESWWLKTPDVALSTDMIAVDWTRQTASETASERELTSDEKSILEGYNEFEKKYKQPGGTMFFNQIENFGYFHAYLSKDNSEILGIDVINDPEYLKSIYVKGKLTITSKLSCEVITRINE